MSPKHAAWLLLALAACNRSPQPQPPQAAAAASPATTAAPAAATTDLQDISERNPQYLIGISFPPELKRYPALAAVVKRDAEAMRAEFLRQVAENKDYPGTGPFELSLMYSLVAQAPRIVAVAAEGTSFVGGAHGAPLLERYVWLLPDDRRLTAAELIPDPASWTTVSGFVREHLLAVQKQRFEEDAKSDPQADPAVLKQQLKNATDMVEQGTEPKLENFVDFEPVLGADGKIDALRFVFPPYQVGPYSDGTQKVEVAASVLLPLIAPAERGLFAGG